MIWDAFCTIENAMYLGIFYDKNLTLLVKYGLIKILYVLS